MLSCIQTWISRGITYYFSPCFSLSLALAALFGSLFVVMSTRYTYVDREGCFEERKLLRERDKILPRFLALPPKDSLTLGMTIVTDIYITIRAVKIHKLGAGVFAYVMMPHSSNVQQQPIEIKSQN